MNNRLIIFILILAGAMLLNGCTAKIVDTNTEQKISELENPDPSYIKEEIKTDGMLADIDYGGQHPFSMGNEVEDSTSAKNDSMAKPLQLSEEEYFILADVRWRGFYDSQSESAAFVKDEIVGKVVGYEKSE
ncbi:hypothetical protein [Paenibacillus sp. LHD-38]|uniref:hypothetical protein n=1 Tax=Paenibacillus sp. LHD-38 TaxID=3072143 RepID=UPI00280F2224|nr:hypothetical protein [Paenibacillus sp. LHD-38]MDQ8734374.1 hypothetical protein [Paenibacillus sp. LHD-38]